MKQKPQYQFLLGLFILFSGSFAAQRIQNFYLLQAGGSVGVRFTIAKGPQCSGYTIYHSTDSINFFQIYDYAGICGDQTNNVEYSFTHTSPAANQVNYYKVKIFPFEESPVARIFVGQGRFTRLQPFPNPVYNSLDPLGLKFFGLNNARLAGFLYNQFGKPLRTLEFTTAGEIAYIPVGDLENGLYVLWFTDGTQAYSAKFIVQR